MTQPIVTEIKRVKPTLNELVTVFTQAVENVESHNLPFTAHHITQEARVIAPHLELAHETIRAAVLAFIPASSNYAVIPGAQFGDNEARLFVKVLAH